MKMRSTVLVLLTGLALASLTQAQGRGGAPQPALMECGVHGDIDIICGTRSPEDLEATADGKSLIVSQFVNGRAGAGIAGLMLFDISKKTFTRLTATPEPLKGWGDPACPGPIGDMLAPHGISLSKRNGGAIELYVVNHGGRESIEMFEMKQSGAKWDLIWHGCVVSTKDFNDVAALPDGGFIATHPTALQPPAPPSGQGKAPQAGAIDIFSGQPSGYVSRWSTDKGEVELPGTRAGYPNGILVSSDGRYMYFNAWTAKEVHKYDLKEGKETGMVKLDFMPDNISWTSKRTMLAAGVKGARGDCPAGSSTPCILGFGVAEIDPAKMEAKTVFDSEGKGALISGVSEALQAGSSIYIGAFQGDRIVKIPAKK
jgi:hypothetical protein